MLQQEYKIDENGKEILLKDNKHQVMMEWEKPYMEACIDKLQPKGHVLEIGFGMGYSATQIQKYKPKSHTIIEMDPMVIKKLQEWAKDYDNIIIVEGTWQEKLDDLEKYDEIFFDDYPLFVPKNEIEKKIIGERFYMFLDICLQSHTKSNAKFSVYLPNSNGGFKKRMLQNPKVDYKEYSMGINIPENCNYHIDDKVIIPIIQKKI